jgi:hypothetical protein
VCDNIMGKQGREIPLGVFNVSNCNLQQVIFRKILKSPRIIGIKSAGKPRIGPSKHLPNLVLVARHDNRAVLGLPRHFFNNGV